MKKEFRDIPSDERFNNQHKLISLEEKLNTIKKTIKFDEGKPNYRQWESGAKRDSDSTKAAIHNLKGYTRLRFGYHMRMGANKYGDSNWELGMPTNQYLESLDRHLALYLEGDRSEDHLSAMLFGIQGCMMNEKKEGITETHFFNKK